MDVKVLVASMTVILIILFFVTDFYRKGEIDLMKAEAKYYKLIKEIHKNPGDEELKKRAKEAGQRYGRLAKLDEKEIAEMLEQDISPAPA